MRPVTFPEFFRLDEALADQARLRTPVVELAERHGAARAGDRLSSLIPLTAPGPGEQYAFEVNLDACTGCKSCVAACHSLNGLDETETWRDVGLIVGADARSPFQQTLTSACHHCADPGCLNGCPVLAYEKDPVTGIVRHLDDQCIGCGYCQLKCPFDVPKFNQRLGIVRKCDMCHGRLSAGEAPACVQACPTHAIRIVHVPAGARARTEAFAPAAPDPSYTRPTTRYITQRKLPERLMAADADALRPQCPHWPLAVMLTLLPFAVAAQVLLACGIPSPPDFPLEIASLAAGAIGLAASFLHLGQPTRAWRIFLGLRRSWLSREAVLFGLWFGLSGMAWLRFIPTAVPAVLGVLALGCSAMIYVDTRRRFWRAAQTFPRFFGAGFVAALATAQPVAAALLLGLKLAFEAASIVGSGVSARLQRGPLRAAVAIRIALAAAGIAAWFLLGAVPAFVVLLAGELAERHLFFRAVDAPKMPGFPAAETPARADLAAAVPSPEPA